MINDEKLGSKQPEGEYKLSDVVKRLLTPLYNTGRNVTADNCLPDIESVLLEIKKSYFMLVGIIKKKNKETAAV